MKSLNALNKVLKKPANANKCPFFCLLTIPCMNIRYTKATQEIPQESQGSKALLISDEPAGKGKLEITQGFLWRLGLAFMTLIFEVQSNSRLLWRGLSG